jgi:regulator of replication initiation timing
MTDWNPLLQLARDVLSGKSRSYVTDAHKMALALETLIVEHTSYCVSSKTYLETTENLSATQARCTELLEEARVVREENKRLRESLIKLATAEPGQARACGYEVKQNEFCNLPAPRFFYKYADGRVVDLCSLHAREMRGSQER